MIKELITTAIIFCAAAKSAMAAQYIDMGNLESEISAGVELVNTSEILSSETVGGKHTFRTLNKEGSITFDADCSGTEVNYLTVKLCGSDISDTMLWLVSAESGNMDSEDSHPPYRNGLVDRRDWVELNTCNGETPQYDGGFIYTTYEIPMIYTEGKSKVKLKIMSTGGASDYADVTVKEQKEPSRGVYAIWMTQEPCFNPEISDPMYTEGGAVTPEKLYSLNDETAMTKKQEQAKEILLESIEKIKEFQIYGEGDYPDYMEGMMVRSSLWRLKPYSDDDWKDAFYTNKYMLKQNTTPLNAFEIFAYAYKNAERLYEDKAEENRVELLDRIVKGMDFMCRAQGADGGFYSSDGWIGGPEREISGGSALSGFGLRAVGEAMLLMSDCISKDILNEEIDSDADGIKDLIRSSAWINTFEKCAEFMLSYEGAGHAPNQDMAEIITALRFDMAAKVFGGGGIPVDDIKMALEIAFGKEKNLSCSSYWVSPKGTILENFGSIQGGYSGDYGSLAIAEASQIAQAAKIYGFNYDDEIRKMYNVIDAYYFIGKKKIGNELCAAQYTEGITSNRNSYYPGTERYVVDIYAATELENDTALKIISNYFELRDFDLMSGEEFNVSNAHFEDNVLELMRLYDGFDMLMSEMKRRNIENYNFLMEDPKAKYYAFADEMARSVVIKNGDERIYLSLNWRNPLHSVDYYNDRYKDSQRIRANNLARVHNTNSSYDRYGYAAVDTYTSTTVGYDENGNELKNFARYLDGWTYINQGKINSRYTENGYMQALMEMCYGEYTILMNSNNCGITGTDYNKAYTCAELQLGKYNLVPGERYIDLVNFKEYLCEDEKGIIVLHDNNGDKFLLNTASTAVLIKADGIKVQEVKESFVGKIINGVAYIENRTKPGIVSKNGVYSVYAAEYDDDERLKAVSRGIMELEKNKDFYEVVLEGNASDNARLFIWNGMEPKTEE